MNPSNEVVSNLTSVKIPESVINILSDLIYKAEQAPSSPDARKKRVRPSSEMAPCPFDIPTFRFMLFSESEPIELTGSLVKCSDEFGYSEMIVYDYPPYINDLAM